MRARHFTLDGRDRGDVDALAEAMRGLVEPPADVVAAMSPRSCARCGTTATRAVHDFTRRWDSDAAPEQFRVPAERIAAAPGEIDREVRVGLDVAIANVERLAQAEVAGDLSVEMDAGPVGRDPRARRYGGPARTCPAAAPRIPPPS